MELFPFKKIATLYLDSWRGHFRRVMWLYHAYKYLIWVWILWYICSFKIVALSNSTRCKLANKQSQCSLGGWTTLPVFDSGCPEVVLSPALLVMFPLVHWTAYAMSKGVDLFSLRTKRLETNYALRTGQRITNKKKVPDTKNKWWTQILSFGALSLEYQLSNQLLKKCNMIICFNLLWNHPPPPPWLPLQNTMNQLLLSLLPHPTESSPIYELWLTERMTHLQILLVASKSIFCAKNWRMQHFQTHARVQNWSGRKRMGLK